MSVIGPRRSRSGPEVPVHGKGVWRCRRHPSTRLRRRFARNGGVEETTYRNQNIGRFSVFGKNEGFPVWYTRGTRYKWGTRFTGAPRTVGSGTVSLHDDNRRQDKCPVEGPTGPDSSLGPRHRYPVSDGTGSHPWVPVLLRSSPQGRSFRTGTPRTGPSVVPVRPQRSGAPVREAPTTDRNDRDSRPCPRDGPGTGPLLDLCPGSSRGESPRHRGLPGPSRVP